MAVVRLQLLTLRLLPGDMGGHGVIVGQTPLSLTGVASSSAPWPAACSPALLLLLLLLEYVISVHLLLQEALQDGAAAASSAVAAAGRLLSGGPHLCFALTAHLMEGQAPPAVYRPCVAALTALSGRRHSLLMLRRWGRPAEGPDGALVEVKMRVMMMMMMLLLWGRLVITRGRRQVGQLLVLDFLLTQKVLEMFHDAEALINVEAQTLFLVQNLFPLLRVSVKHPRNLRCFLVTSPAGFMRLQKR